MGDEEDKIDLSEVNLDKAYQGNMIEDENMNFVVDNPVAISGHIVYHVKGVDKHGTWEGNRRYNEFYVLHGALSVRWPGIYIPKVPPKKAIVRASIKCVGKQRCEVCAGKALLLRTLLEKACSI